MSVEQLSDQMNAYSSSLLESATQSDFSGLAKLRRVELHEPAFTKALVSNWTPEVYQAIPASIRLASTLACIQSLVTVASQRPHANYVASRVFNNFQSLSQNLLANRSLSRRELDNYFGDNSVIPRRIVGQLSETAILGALWWSIANDSRPEDLYALPTTKYEDIGTRDAQGFSTGVDIKLKRTGEVEADRIQAKTSTLRHNYSVDYAPGIAVVPVTQLLTSRGERLKGPRQLLDFIAYENCTELSLINKQIDDRLERARIRHAKYQLKSLQETKPVSWKDQLKKIGETLEAQAS